MPAGEKTASVADSTRQSTPSLLDHLQGRACNFSSSNIAARFVFAERPCLPPRSDFGVGRNVKRNTGTGRGCSRTRKSAMLDFSSHRSKEEK